MLDQNTDRMWYVIGAVLIGAAIIFGLNTFMPNAFASVGGMMGDLVDNVSMEKSFDQRLREIGPVESDGVNLLQKDMLLEFRVETLDKSQYETDGSVFLETGNNSASGIQIPLSKLSTVVEPGMVYTFSFSYESTDDRLEILGGHQTTVNNGVHSKAYVDGQPFDYYRPQETPLRINDGERHTIVVHSIMPDDLDDIGDNRGIWIQPNRGMSDAPAWVQLYDLKLEKGMTVTPWSKPQ